jgi:hypothetical protein
MPPKKMVSAKMCDQVIKVQSKNAVNAYRQKAKGDRASPNQYAIFVKQHMQDPKVKRLPVKQRMGAIALLWADAKKKQRVMFMDMSDLDDKPSKSKPKGNFREINKARQKLIRDDEKKSN